MMMLYTIVFILPSVGFARTSGFHDDDDDDHHEQMKKRQYCARVSRIDRGTFTPLVFSTSGMCGPEASLFLKSLASRICTKHADLHYSQVMGQLRSRISFSLIRWAVTCFRGSRSTYFKRSGLSITQACHQLQY